MGNKDRDFARTAFYVSKSEWAAVEKKLVESNCKPFQRMMLDAKVWPTVLKLPPVVFRG
jgi:hypothetical protein